MPNIPIPHPSFLDGCEKYRVDAGKQIYRKYDKYYTWDGLHGEIEVYNKRGFHLMVLDPYGKKIKDAVKGRNINVR